MLFYLEIWPHVSQDLHYRFTFLVTCKNTIFQSYNNIFDKPLANVSIQILPSLHCHLTTFSVSLQGCKTYVQDVH